MDIAQHDCTTLKGIEAYLRMSLAKQFNQAAEVGQKLQFGVVFSTWDVERKSSTDPTMHAFAVADELGPQMHGFARRMAQQMRATGVILTRVDGHELVFCLEHVQFGDLEWRCTMASTGLCNMRGPLPATSAIRMLAPRYMN